MSVRPREETCAHQRWLTEMENSERNRMCDEILQLKADKAELVDVIYNLQFSADALWEQQGEGHDWRESMEAARAAFYKHKKLNGKPTATNSFVKYPCPKCGYKEALPHEDVKNLCKRCQGMAKRKDLG